MKKFRIKGLALYTYWNKGSKSWVTNEFHINGERTADDIKAYIADTKHTRWLVDTRTDQYFYMCDDLLAKQSDNAKQWIKQDMKELSTWL